MVLPAARSIFPAEARITVPPGLATVTPSYCCTTPATLIEPPDCTDRLPPEASPVVVRVTRPDGSSMGVATLMLDPVTAKDPPRVVAAASAAGCVGASSDTAPVADNARFTFAPVVTSDAVSVRLPAVLNPALVELGVVDPAVLGLAVPELAAGAALSEFLAL